jgi:hypothetical protein
MDTREEERDEVLAVFAATRELTPDTDRQLADALLDRLHGAPPGRPLRHRRTGSHPSKNPFSVASMWSALLFTVLSTGMIGALRSTPNGLIFEPTRLPLLYWIGLALIAATLVVCIRLARQYPHRSAAKHFFR